MTLSIKHAFHSSKTDGSDSTLVQPSNWNADHDITMATSSIMGRISAGSGSVEELAYKDVWTILGIVAATAVVFYQATPPTGFTQVTTVNDGAFRVVNDAVSGGTSGGTAGFTTAFASRTISQANLPNYNLYASLSVSASGSTSSDGNHQHSYTNCANNDSGAGSGTTKFWRNNTQGANTGSAGSHNHSVSVSGTASGNIASGGSGTAMDFAVKYMNVIVATRDA